MKPLTYLLGALAVLLIGGFWLRAHDARLQAVATADRTRDSLALATRFQDSVEALRAEKDAIAAHRDSVLRDSLATVRRSLHRARDETAHLTSDLEALLAADTTVPDTLRLAIGHTLTALTARAETCDAALSLADSVASVCSQRLAVRDSTVADLRGLLTAQTGLTEQYRRAARPSLLARLWGHLPWFVVGAALGVVITR